MRWHPARPVMRRTEWVLVGATVAVAVAGLWVGVWQLAVYMFLLGAFQFSAALNRRGAYRAGWFEGRAHMWATIAEGARRGLSAEEIARACAESDAAHALDTRWPP